MTNVREIRKNNSQLAELIERRDELLKQDPSLAELQFKINDILAGAHTENNRQLLLSNLLMDSLKELQLNNEDLANDLSQLDDSYNKLIHTLKEFEDGQ